MIRLSSKPSQLTGPQIRALQAAAKGQITCRIQYRRRILTCPGIGANALWGLLRHGLICDGSWKDEQCIMVLTPKGRHELQVTSPMCAPPKPRVTLPPTDEREITPYVWVHPDEER